MDMSKTNVRNDDITMPSVRHPIRSERHRQSEGECQEPDAPAIELVLVAGEHAGAGGLPDRLDGPAGRQSADARGVAPDPQRIGAEGGVVAGALGPPGGA